MSAEKRIVVTGASRGLGRAYAVALARDGALLVLNGTDAAALDETAAQVRSVGDAPIVVVGSITDDEVAKELVDRCVTDHGGIDAVVNNAGLIHQRMLHHMTPAEFDEELAVNLRGTWSVSRHAIAAMKPAGGGLLLQISSVSALTGCFGQTGYAAAKGGVLAMLYAWGGELAGSGIRVNALCPAAVSGTSEGFIERLQNAASKRGQAVPTAREIGFGEVGEVAELVAVLCSDAAAHIDGQVITFNGRTLEMWAHPVPSSSVEQTSWTAEQLATALAAGAWTK